MQFRHAGFHVTAPATVIRLRCRFCQEPGSLYPRRHICQLKLNRLMFAYGFAETLTHLGVGDRLLKTSARYPNTPSRNVDSAQFKSGQYLLQPPSLFFTNKIFT